MPLWAKVDVDMPTDHKLRGQSVVTRHLWTCLICEAKKQDDSGAVRGFDCGLLASAFNLPRKAVAEALTHYQAQRMLELDVDGTMRLLNFTKRQGETTHAERRAVWAGQKRRQRGGVHHGHVGLSTQDVRSPELEEEIDQEKETKEEKVSSFSQDPEIARTSQTDATPTEQAKIKHALGLDRKAARG